ncbi:glycogen synthase [Hufsiella ginkgonis]|uniref:Glycogen synthase n=1 Tax=Hufsiella ginkgonis TaxID=2695274 RepID=A0A7K1XUI2_9SPHI|nr:glycogen/starch synthase [Hufsiella ginkgonis]MXV14620.1 glycosyltransferase [Hufsiella ginkgonis]
MNVIHLSAECYPVAKVGGLGDVVGALPKYQCLAGVNASVVMPFYDRKFTRDNRFETVYEGSSTLGNRPFHFTVLKEITNQLGFSLYLIRIPGLLDRPEVYCYNDESEQFLAFQVAFLDWIVQREERPHILHCHDHHMGLVPFLITSSYRYRSLANVPTVVTVHNGQYQGWMSWDKADLLPEIDLSKKGLLDWDGVINPLAAAIKCCWRFTAVSPSYMAELSHNSNGLEYLFAAESGKGQGIINGIDTEVWNPQTDPMLARKYNVRSVAAGKQANKEPLAGASGLDPSKPLVAFIGRLVNEKGADLLPGAIRLSLEKNPGLNFLVLGSGEAEIEDQLRELNELFPGRYHATIGYNEVLSHKIYAAADFLVMPSRVEPCGLNQLYSLRYGTMPIVRSTGGLKDTVIDIETPEGYGITFTSLSVAGICAAIDRAVALYPDTARTGTLRKKMMGLDFSWHQSANQYINLYNSLY